MKNFLRKVFKKSPSLKPEEIEFLIDNVEENDKIVGVVEIYKGDASNPTKEEFIERGFNLVTYTGREFAASKTFDLGNYTNWKITHFGIGQGGTADDGVTKVGPKDQDTDLYSPLTLNKNGNGYLRDGILKPINNKELIIDDNTEKYTTIVNTLKIVVNEEPDLNPPVAIDETALFYTNGNNWRLFSHYTTTKKILEENESITFKWYILF